LLKLTHYRNSPALAESSLLGYNWLESMTSPTSGFANWIRPHAVTVIRALPKVRGRGRLAKICNDALLAAGANPVATSRMNAGHLLLVDTRLFSHCMFLFNGYTGIEDLFAPLISLLQPGGVAIDVGANVGTVSVPLALAARRIGARLISFEPFPRNVEWMRQNLQANQVEDTVTIVNCGLSSAPGEATLLLREDFETGAAVGNASIAEPGNDERFQRVTIQLNTLDSLWPSFGSPRLDIVKIDIEGHEDRFLDGAKETLAANRPAILMEVNRYFFTKRGLDFNKVIPQSLPPDYRFFTSGQTEIKDLADCHQSDILLVPAEKANRMHA
jgi:FkbM family methyltransferase